MSDPRVNIASQALARLGELQITSFEEDSDAAEKVRLMYEPLVQALFAAYIWQFALTRETLQEDAAAKPSSGWNRAFLMPELGAERVGSPRRVYGSAGIYARPLLHYDIWQRWVVTNSDTCVIEYVRRQPETLWPGYFTTLAVEALAARLALPVTENASKEEWHDRIAYGTPQENRKGGLMAAAMSADSTGTAPQSLLDDDDAMTAARFGGARLGSTYF